MRLFIRPILAATAVLAAFGPLLPADAQVDSREGITLQNEIYQLRQELKTFEDQSTRSGGARQPSYNPPPPQQYNGDIVAQLLTRLDALEEQVRELRGRMDETQNQLQRQGEDLGKRIDDLGFQVNSQGSLSPGGGGAALSGPSTTANNPQVASSRPPPSYPPPAPPLGQGPGPTLLTPPPSVARPSGPRTPEIALQDGNSALNRHDYQSAEAAAKEVLTNRTSPRAYDAQLLLAAALSGERQYAQAAIAYDDAYNRSHKGSHAQDALVGLANSLTAINEKTAACDTLTRLRTEFPQPRPDIRDSAAAAGQRAGCRS